MVAVTHVETFITIVVISKNNDITLTTDDAISTVSAHLSIECQQLFILSDVKRI